MKKLRLNQHIIYSKPLSSLHLQISVERKMSHPLVIFFLHSGQVSFLSEFSKSVHHQLPTEYSVSPTEYSVKAEY